MHEERVVKFPTADEARKKIENGETINKNKELEDIKRKIVVAIDKGECSLYIQDVRIMDSTTRFLENQGYSVQVGGRYNEVNTLISW